MIEIDIYAPGVQLGDKTVLQPQSYRMAPGELVGLVGPNGAGKSTLLKLMGGLLASAVTDVHVNGNDIDWLKPSVLARQVTWLAQTRQLSWDLLVEDVVALGRHAWGGGRFGRLGEEDRARVVSAMEEAGASALAGRHVLSLSGGEQARVHLARFFAGDGDVLLLDEPLAALDIAHQLSIMAALERKRSEGKTVCLALHDLRLAQAWCNRVIVLDKGGCVADGPPREALHNDVLHSVFSVVDAGNGAFKPA
ncbi:ABC transporter ATP-binding protein [Henriciella litoralis]|uniref:ABC transporter ATP-binding protein n=1 Tax=Henriciella litoralis TaxID=568102 RepID=UPI000A001BA1|nr:ABC transporter ATP-binding protein [Henriciella litoralis]